MPYSCKKPTTVKGVLVGQYNEGALGPNFTTFRPVRKGEEGLGDEDPPIAKNIPKRSTFWPTGAFTA